MRKKISQNTEFKLFGVCSIQKFFSAINYFYFTFFKKDKIGPSSSFPNNKENVTLEKLCFMFVSYTHVTKRIMDTNINQLH